MLVADRKSLCGGQCMSAAVQKDKSPSRGLMLASICMLPFQPMLVTAIHAGLVEVQSLAGSS